MAALGYLHAPEAPAMAQDKLGPLDQLSLSVRELRILLWLQEKSQDGKGSCPFCGFASWIVAPELVQPWPYGIGNTSLPAPSPRMTAYPQVMVTCSNCGNTLYFNALITGTLKPAPDSGARSDG